MAGPKQRTPAGQPSPVALATVSAADSSRPGTRSWFSEAAADRDAGGGRYRSTRTAGWPRGRARRRPAAAGLRGNPQSPSRARCERPDALRACSSVPSTRTGRRGRRTPRSGHSDSGRACRHRSFGPPGDVERRNCGRVIRTRRSQSRWTAGSGTVHRHRTHDRAAGRTTQHQYRRSQSGGSYRARSLIIRSVAWCSTSIWSAPDGSGLLRLDRSSIQTDPDGSSWIVWMIKRMIK